MNQVEIVVLAAGHGRRMNNQELPKVLIPLRGVPIIKYLLQAIAESGVCQRPIVVIGKKGDQVRAALGEDYRYAVQDQQLGTGHAVNCARAALADSQRDVVVLYGDHPFITPTMIQRLVSTHQDSGAVLTMGTVVVPDFNDWRATFRDFGRVARDGKGNVSAIVEKKDATPDQLAMQEVNPSYFCFKADWLWGTIDRLNNKNAQQEYYLTDLASLACEEGRPITTVQIDAREALGVNTPEQLALIEQLFDQR